MKKYKRHEVKREVKEVVDQEVEAVTGFIKTKDTTGDDKELNHSHVTIKE